MFPHVLSLKRKHLLTDREKYYKTKFINTWTLNYLCLENVLHKDTDGFSF